MTRADVITSEEVVEADIAAERGGLWQTVAVVTLVVIASGTGYSVRKSSLDADTTSGDTTGQSVADTSAAVAPIPGATGASQPTPGVARAVRTSPPETCPTSA